MMKTIGIWYLVQAQRVLMLATRRDALTRGVSHQNAHVFVYDLDAREFVDTDSSTDGLQTGLGYRDSQ